MNEDQLWGCFYTFPELYSDVYSPIVHVRKTEDVPEIKDGILTRDLVGACLSYLKRIPILGDFVFIKLDLSSKVEYTKNSKISIKIATPVLKT